MSAIRIAPFLGMLPRVADRLLPEGAAVDATNVDLTSGEIRPIRTPVLVHTPAISGPWLSVYRAERDEVVKWLSWAADVDIARAPLSEDVEPRYYWTGDGEPRFATFGGLPGTFYALGIPNPQGKPTVTPSGGAGTDVSRVYGYTFFSALGEESAMSPASDLTTGKVDGTWTIASMDAFPASSGTGTATHAAGVTTFNNTGNHWLRAGEEITIDATKVTVESTPNASTFTVAGDFSAATAWSRVAPWNTAGMKRRLYRSAGTTASYQLVNDDVGTSYNDTLTDAQIMGDELISSDWFPPPVGMRGMIALPSGSMAGFVGNQLCLSEPFQPHAWPTKYQFGCDFEIRAIEAFGTTIVVGTAGLPYVADGSDPSVMSLDKIGKVWPCLSKRSMASVGDGVVYATAAGMAYIGMAGSSLISDGGYTKIEWTPLDPSSMVTAVSENKIFVRFRGADGAYGILVFAPADGNGIKRLSCEADELYSDPRNGKLYIVDSTGVNEYDSGVGARLQFSWKSREFHMASPSNVGAAKVDFISEQSQADYDADMAKYESEVAANAALVSSYAGLGGINGSSVNRMLVNGSSIRSIAPPQTASVTFTLYSNGKAVFSRNLVESSRAFRLPAGFKTENLAIGLTGTVRVQSVKLADTPSGLKSV